MVGELTIGCEGSIRSSRMEKVVRAGAQKALLVDEEDAPFRFPKRLPYKPTIPISEIRRVVAKVIAERRKREKTQSKPAGC